MANLPSEKNDSENAKGWREQLQDIRPLLPANIPAENKIAVKADIREASRGHIEIVAAGKNTPLPPPREINTSGVRDVLREDMKGMNLDILQENASPPVNASMSPGEVRVFETVMNQGFMDGRITSTENDPALVVINEIREKLKDVAVSLYKASKNLDPKNTSKLDLAFTDLSQRIADTISVGGPEMEQNLKKLSDEVATVGTPEWEKRFVDNGDMRQPAREISVRANPADALERHTLDEAIDTIEKKLNKAVITVEMAFRNGAFDEKRMEKFHSAAVDLAERIQKVIDEANAGSIENTLRRLEELSVEIPSLEKEEQDNKKMPSAPDTKNDTKETQVPSPQESASIAPPQGEAPKTENGVILKEKPASVPKENNENGGESTVGTETGTATTTAFAKPSLADEVLAKMNPSKILPTEEATVQPEKIPDIGSPLKEVLPTFSAENPFEKLGETYTVKTGDNVWNIIKAKLGGNENFSKLPPREQNFIIDSIKDKIVKMSPKELQDIGIKGDPNRVYPGDELKLGKVFNSSDDLMKMLNRAVGSATATEQHVVA